MCNDCWEKSGSPTDLPATYEQFAELYSQLYDFNSVGGPLHAVLDDWNLDRHIEPYPGLDFIDEMDQTDNTEYVYQLCQEIADLLNAMSLPQRRAALAKVKGLF
jgi:hypothetical protein